MTDDIKKIIEFHEDHLKFMCDSNAESKQKFDREVYTDGEIELQKVILYDLGVLLNIAKESIRPSSPLGPLSIQERIEYAKKGVIL